MVEADLRCLRELLQRDPDWRYFLNLPGSMLPAFSIRETEDILQRGLRGGSLAMSYPVPEVERDRFLFKHSLKHWYVWSSSR